MRPAAIPVFFVAALLSGTLHAASISSDAWTLAIDDATGDVTSLRDTEGHEYLNGKPAPIFRLRITDLAGQSSYISASAARAREATSSDGELILSFTDVSQPGLSAIVRVRSAGSALLFQCALTNAESGAMIDEVFFPDLPLKPSLGEDPADDRFVMPWGDGVVLTRTLIDRLGWSPTRNYPGNSAMQFAAFYDDTRGLSLTCRDTAGEYKAIGYEKREDLLRLRLSIQRPHAANLPFTGPEYALEPCAGSWAAAAENYKRWAREQPWATAPDSRPDWLKQMPLMIDMHMRPLGNGKMFVPLDRVGEWAESWRQATGAPHVVAMVRSWEKHGVYVMPDCLPIYPTPEKFAEVTGQLHARGHHAASMVAGLKWVIEREPFHTPHYNILGFKGRADFEKNAPPVCALDPDGKPWEDKPYFTWDGTRAHICPGTDYALDYYPRIARELAQRGLDLFEFDQMNGGGVSHHCYSPDHGHPPGPGPWVAQRIREIFRRSREAGRAVNPDFAITMEECGEFYLDLMDTYCGRNHKLATWPAMGEGSFVVPLFTYVYHAVKPSMTLDLQQSVLDPSPGLREEMRIEGLTGVARAFIWGRMLYADLRAWEIMHKFGLDDLLPTPDKMFADHWTLFRNTAATHWGPGFEFLSAGELIPLAAPVGVPVRPVNLKNGDEEFIHMEPAVLASSFALPDGRRAWFYVSTAEDAVTFAPHEVAAAQPLDLWRNGEREGPCSQASAPGPITMQPYDALAIIPAAD